MCSSVFQDVSKHQLILVDVLVFILVITLIHFCVSKLIHVCFNYNYDVNLSLAQLSFAYAYCVFLTSILPFVRILVYLSCFSDVKR